MSLLDKFLNTQHNLSKSTRDNYQCAVLQWNKHCELSFEEGYLNSELIHQVLDYIAEDIEASTWNSYVLRYKRLAKWLSDPEDLDIPRVWRAVKLKKIDWGKELEEKRLSDEEVQSVILAGDHPRDKALVGVCWEGGLRAGELLGMRINDCHRLNYGYDVTVSGKTGTRTVPIVLTAPLLEMWLNNHPNRNDKQAYVFVRRKGGNFMPLTVKGANLILTIMVRRAGIKKPVTIHWFRHTTATWCSEHGMNEAQMRQLFGWTDKSNMPSRYTHLHKGVAARTKLALVGVEKFEVKTERPLMEPRKCFRCGTMNSFDAGHCQQCGLPLNREEAEKVLAEKDRVSELERKYDELKKGLDEIVRDSRVYPFSPYRMELEKAKGKKK